MELGVRGSKQTLNLKNCVISRCDVVSKKYIWATRKSWGVHGKERGTMEVPTIMISPTSIAISSYNWTTTLTLNILIGFFFK